MARKSELASSFLASIDKEVKQIERASKEIKTRDPILSVGDAVDRTFRWSEIKDRDLFVWTLEQSHAYFIDHGRQPTADELLNSSSSFGNWFLPYRTHEVRIVIEDPWFSKAAWLRGIRPDGSGLDSRQLLLLAELTNVASRASLDTKLRKVGVSEAEYNTWLAFPPFKRRLDTLSENALSAAQSQVHMALIQQAGSGKLEHIKYYNKMSGRFDDSAGQAVDLKAFTMGVIDILMQEIQDPEKLQNIAAKLSLLIAGHTDESGL